MTRTHRAFLVAPLVAVVAVWAGYLAYAVAVLPEHVPAGAYPHTLFFFVFFGAPPAYAMTAVLGVPAVGALRRIGWLRLGPLLALGALAGGVGPSLVWWWFWGAMEPGLVAIGGAAGGLAAAAFWAMAVRPPASRPAA